MTSGEFIERAGFTLNDQALFVPLRDAFPELLPAAKPFEACMATVNMGAAVIFGFKTADDMNYGDVVWHLNRLLALVRKPGQIDAVEYFGVLVLVFEKSIPPEKAARLTELRKRNWLGRGLVKVVLVELPGKIVWGSDFPRTMKHLLDPFNSALSMEGEVPAERKPMPSFGQKGRTTQLAVAGILLTGLLAAVHVGVQLSEGHHSFLLRLYRFGARHYSAFEVGEYYRFLSANFLHASWDHLLFNVIAFYEYARGVEPLFGAGWLFALFVITGAFGSFFSAVVSPGPMSVGASGAVCGLAGVLVMVYFLRKEKLTLRFRAHFFGAALLANSYAIIRGFLSGGPIDNWAHLGGFLSGCLAGVLLPLDRSSRSRWSGRIAGIGAIALSLAAAGGVLSDFKPGRGPLVSTKSEVMEGAIDYPKGWYSTVEEEGRRMKFGNGLLAFMVLERSGQKIDWIVRMPAAERRDLLQEFFSKAGENVKVTEVADTYIGRARVFRVRLKRESPGLERVEEENLLLPDSSGYLRLMTVCWGRDADYYRPIFTRTALTLRTSAQPAGLLEEAAGR